MRTLVICFSQTKNTWKIAEMIQQGILSQTGSCKLAAMDETDPAAVPDYDLIGLGCPVFYCQEPFNVRDFIQCLPSLSGKQAFVFCTHANVMGKCLVLLWESLKAKGATMVGHHHTYADVWVPFYPNPSYTSGHPDEVDLEEAHAFGSHVVAAGQRAPQGDMQGILAPEPPDDPFSDRAESFTPEFLREALPPLSIDTDKCVQCAECETNCPVSGIDTSAQPPRIQSPCIFCLRCVMVCPERAITADWSPLVAQAPENYAHYRRLLDEAAARGEFRWLVDPDSVDATKPFWQCT